MYAIKREKSVGHRGAEHVGLQGASQTFRYRPTRLDATELASTLTCELVRGDQVFGPMPVLDVSPTGLGLELRESIILPLGTILDEVRLLQDGAVVANERAVVVNLLPGTPPRLGLRLVSGLFDLGVLKLRDAASAGSLHALINEFREDRELLPGAWRSEVADLAQMLKRTRDFFERIESSHDGAPAQEHERELFEELFLVWGPEYHGQLRRLQTMTEELSDEARERGLEYAAHLLLPLVYCSPIHRRAYDKPQGYAGDFELMRLFITPEIEGETLYARFLHYVGQRYPTARTVVSRERTMRSAVRERLEQGRPLRVLCLACGPALELQNVLREVAEVGQRVELFLLDQDEDALAHAHHGVRKVLAERGEAMAGVELNALHFSVIQLLRPRDEAEAAVARELLSEMDFVYSAGLFDYLPRSIARRLTQRLFGMLRPGGELFLGNLRQDPASAWMMEHATAWHLIYREPDEMMALADGIDAEETEIVLDETERCMFLRVLRDR